MPSLRQATLAMTATLAVACAAPAPTERPALVARADLAPATPAPVLLEGTPYAEVLDVVDTLAPDDASLLYQSLARELALEGRGEAAGAVLAHARARGAEVSTAHTAGALVVGCAVGLGRCGVPLELSLAAPSLDAVPWLTRSRNARLDALLTAASRGSGENAVGLIGLVFHEVMSLPSPRARSARWPAILEAADAAGDTELGAKVWLSAREDARALGDDRYAPTAWEGLCAWGVFAPDRVAPCARALELGVSGGALEARRGEVALDLARRGQWGDCVMVSAGLDDPALDHVEQIAARRGALEPLLQLAALRPDVPAAAATSRALARAAASGHVEPVRALLAARAEAAEEQDDLDGLDKLDAFVVEVASLELADALAGAPDLESWDALSGRVSRFVVDDRSLVIALDLIRALARRDGARAERELRATLSRLPRRVRSRGANGSLYDVRDVSTLVGHLTRSRDDHALVDVLFEGVVDPQNVAEACRALSDALATGAAQTPSASQSLAHMTRCARARALEASPRPRRLEGPGGEPRGETSVGYYERLLGELTRRGSVELTSSHLIDAVEDGLDVRAPRVLVDALARRGLHAELMRLARALESRRATGWSIVWARALDATPSADLPDALGASDPRRPGPRLSLALARAHLRAVGTERRVRAARVLDAAPDVIDDPAWREVAGGLAVRGERGAARELARRERDPVARAWLLLELAR